MAKPSVTLRTIKGSPLSFAEGDANFTALQQASVPDGGSSGQILVKSTNANYDYAWATPGSFQGLQGVQGSSGPIGPAGVTGSGGATGVQGVQGIQGLSGFSANIFDYGVNTQSSTGDPGQGLLIYTQVNQTSSTQILISKTTARGQAVNTYLNLLTLGTRFLIQDSSNPSNYQLWRMTGSVQDQGTYLGLPASIVSSAGTGTTGLANQTACLFSMDTGVQGVQGVQGHQGVQGPSGPNTQVTTTQPGSASVGDQWFNSATQLLHIYTATGWVQVAVDDSTF